MRRLKEMILGLIGRSQAELVRRANAGYDMASDRDEAYYRQQYLQWIVPELEKAPGRSLRILDLGCGHGRLTVPLAGWAYSGRVVAVDFSPDSLEAARRLCAEARLSNVEFIESDAATYARSVPSGWFDAVVCAEMLYNLPDYRATLGELARALKPGGLLAASFRTRWFDLLKSVRAGNFRNARMVLERTEGYWAGGSVWSAWHDSSELKRLLEGFGFHPPSLFGIGVCSGIEGDPMAAVARPSRLDERGRAGLSAIESLAARAYADQGRYLLALARKKG